MKPINLILFVLLVLNSCNNNNKLPENKLFSDSLGIYHYDFKQLTVQNKIENITVPDKFYEINTVILNRNTNMGHNFYQYHDIGSTSSLLCHNTYYKNDNLYLIIECRSESYGIYASRLFIKMKGSSYSGNAFYIKWTNRSPAHELLKSDTYVDSPFYIWELGKSTDTVYTNLDEKIIRSTYPDFKGVFVYKKYNIITLDYKYNPNKPEFYDNIKMDSIQNFVPIAY